MLHSLSILLTISKFLKILWDKQKCSRRINQATSNALINEMNVNKCESDVEGGGCISSVHREPRSHYCRKIKKLMSGPKQTATAELSAETLKVIESS